MRRNRVDLRRRGNLDYADINTDTAAHKVTRRGQPIQLGPTEFRCCATSSNILDGYSGDAVWRRAVYVEQRTVDVHIRPLRKAINVNDTLPDVMRTVRSAGYALDADAQDLAA